jgi:hypothetical protein
LLSQAVAEYDVTHERELALYLSWLAQAHIYAGNLDQAVAVALRALRLTAAGSSTRSTQRLQLIRELLTAHRNIKAVQEFEDEARATLS